jgi:pimeloyl-ACP methyl ester carboxylesterase
MLMRNKKRKLLLWAGAALAASTVYVQWSSRQAERKNPPSGRFLTADGTRLHYLDTGGPGPAVLWLHGNGTMARDLEISGIMGALASEYRVLAFDRPGFGYSTRPRNRSWTPAEQADLIFAALRQKGIADTIILAHSWGNLIALELALRQPEFVKGLLLVGGFYFPVPRADVPVLALPAIPVVGDVMRYTISPLIARAIIPRAIRKMFEPQPVDNRFAQQFPIGLALRPVTLRAGAEETAMMIPAAAALEKHYAQIRQPTVILAGSADQIVDVQKQSVRLHEAIPHSELIVQQDEGHMVHYHASHVVERAVDKLASASRLAANAA